MRDASPNHTNKSKILDDKDTLLMLCEKYQAKEFCNPNIISLGIKHDIFGHWCLGHREVVEPIIKKIKKILSLKLTSAENVVNEQSLLIIEQIGKGVKTDFGFNDLKHKLYSQHIVPDLEERIRRLDTILNFWKKNMRFAQIDLTKIKTIPIPSVFGQISSSQRVNREFFRCPIKEEKTPSFCWYKKQNSFYCFSCSMGGDVIELTKILKKCDFRNALDYLSRISL